MLSLTTYCWRTQNTHPFVGVGRMLLLNWRENKSVASVTAAKGWRSLEFPSKMIQIIRGILQDICLIEERDILTN